MSKQIDDGGPAFPILDDAGSGLRLREGGMSLRDYLAAKAMQSLIISGFKNEREVLPYSIEPERNLEYANARGRDSLARHAYIFADAMLEARKQ